MKVQTGIIYCATLSVACALEPYRIPIQRVLRSSSDSTSQHVDKILAKYSLPPGEMSAWSTGKPVPRVYQQIIKEINSDHSTKDNLFMQAAPRRSRQIDSERVPIEYNPSEVAFVGLVGIGTPNQYFNLEFDIGSSDTWVTGASANCTRDTKCPESRPVFYPERSKTFDSNPNVTWTKSLGEGKGINGTLVTDTIQISQFVINRQTIAIADSIDGIPDNGIDGSVGLGFHELTFHDDPTPVENLISAGSMRSEIGIWLGNGKQGGELIFGGRDRARYYGEMSYFNVPKDSAYWSIGVNSVSVVSGRVEGESDKNTFRNNEIKADSTQRNSTPKVIFDTSTNIILLPPSIAKSVHQYIHNYLFGFYSGYSLIYGKYTVSCNLAKMDTDIWINFGTPSPRFSDLQPTSANKTNIVTSPLPKTGRGAPPKGVPREGTGSKYVPLANEQQSSKIEDDNTSNIVRFKISGRDLVREPVPVFGSLGGVCYSAIQASNSDDDDWVFGNIWFMNNYMTLNHRYRQVGIAPAVQG